MGPAELHDRRDPQPAARRLYLWLGVPGLVLGVPPLFLIWYSYDVYAGRMRDRATFSSEVASFRDELAAAVRSQDELRDAQRRVAAEIERARSIQADLLPRRAPDVPGLELAHRIEFMTEMGGDYFDFVAAAPTAAWASSAATSWARACRRL